MSDYDPNYVPKKQYFRVGGKAIVLDKDGKILVWQRCESAGGGGKWSLPGGALEKDETPIDSIKREIREETKLEVKDVKPFSFRTYIHEGDSILIVGYTCEAGSDEITLNWEHDSYKWFTKDEVLKLDLTEDGKYFVEQLE